MWSSSGSSIFVSAPPFLFTGPARPCREAPFLILWFQLRRRSRKGCYRRVTHKLDLGDGKLLTLPCPWKARFAHSSCTRSCFQATALRGQGVRGPSGRGRTREGLRRAGEEISAFPPKTSLAGCLLKLQTTTAERPAFPAASLCPPREWGQFEVSPGKLLSFRI